MGSCAAPSAKGDDKFITTDYLQQCRDPSCSIRQTEAGLHFSTLRKAFARTSAE
ncbi:replication initiator protein [Klebsiella variicola]|nr:replication initiator protein [Klebsiella variicola]